MIIIIIRLLHPHSHYPPFIRNFANKENSSMKRVVLKEKLLRFPANLGVNDHPQELGTDATNIAHPNM